MQFLLEMPGLLLPLPEEGTSLPDVPEQGCASEFNISPGYLLLLLFFCLFGKEAELISIPGWSKTVRNLRGL